MMIKRAAHEKETNPNYFDFSDEHKHDQVEN